MSQVKERAINKAKAYVSDYLSKHHCVDCGEADPDVLDFDHVRGEKVCDVSHMVQCGFRLWRIVDEIEKCEVRCANDHRRITAKRRRENTAGVAQLVERQISNLNVAGSFPVTRSN